MRESNKKLKEDSIMALEHCIIELCKKHVISLCTLILSLQPSPQNIDSAMVCCVDGESVRG